MNKTHSVYSGTISASTISVAEIENFQFHYDERCAYVNIYIKGDSDESLNYIDSITKIITDLEDLKQVALEWYTKNIIEKAYWKGRKENHRCQRK